MEVSLNYTEPKKERDTGDGTTIEIPFDLLQYLSINDCNLQKVCRICLTISGAMIPFNKELDMLCMLSSFTSVQVCPDDGLPQQICELCKSQVEHCYDFKIKCEKSDCTLRSLLEESSTKTLIDKIKIADNVTNEQNVGEFTIKDESDIQVEVLEDMNDIASDNESLIIIHNVGESKKKCNKKSSSLKTEFNNYMENVTAKKQSYKEKKSYDCLFCAKIFLSSKQLKRHMKKHENTEKYTYSCAQCKHSFSSEHDLKLHSALHNKGPTWKCNKCEKEFKAKPMLNRHIQRHMELKRYACDTCGKPFTELFALRRHTRVHTGEIVEKKHVCHICDKRYSESKQLAVHIAGHSGARPYVCSCGKSFPSARLLGSHKLVHSDRKPYPCSYCDKRFRHESTRNIHHRTHTGEKPYICSTCGKTFIQNSNLTLHMRTHTGEKPYACDVCDRKFTSGSSLKCHQRTHTGEKPYSCKICGKKFARMDLSIHMRNHTGERPFACSVCPKKFINATRLRDHCRMHTGERPYECANCPLKFTTKSHLVKHLKTHEIKKQDNQQSSIDTQSAVVFVRRLDNPIIVTDKYIITNSKDTDIESEYIKENGTQPNDIEVPLEVSGELVLQDDGEIKTEVIVVDNSQNNIEYTDGIAYVNSDVNSDGDLVTVNGEGQGEVNIATQEGVMEGTTLKLYQVDQSLVHIHRSGDQLTIRKITSKMTANF